MKLSVIKGRANSRKTTKAMELAFKRAVSGGVVAFINTEETQEWVYDKFVEMRDAAGISEAEFNGLELYTSTSEPTEHEIQSNIAGLFIEIQHVDLIVVDGNVYRDLEYFSRLAIAKKVDVAYTLSIKSDEIPSKGRKSFAKVETTEVQ